MTSGKSNKFAVLQGNLDGRPLIAMIDRGLQNSRASRETPWLLSLSTPLSNPTPEGLPGIDEAGSLNRWEDVIEKQLANRCKFVFVGRVTWNRQRELLYYVDEPFAIIPELRRLIDGNIVRPFAFECEQDPEWTKVSIYLRS